MPAVDPLAVYGAALATVTAAWSAINELRTRRPRVRVSGMLSVSVDDHDQISTLTNAVATGGSPDLPWRIEIDIVNVGRADAEISTVFVRQQTEQGARTWRPNSGLPRTLKADQGARLVISGRDARVLSGTPLTAVAETASGRRFESDDFGSRASTVLVMPIGVFEATLGAPLDDLPGVVAYEVNLMEDESKDEQ